MRQSSLGIPSLVLTPTWSARPSSMAKMPSTCACCQERLNQLPSMISLLHCNTAHWLWGVPPCEKPSQDLLLGTLSEPGIYSLHPCECFGAAYANIEPVDEASDAAVPRNPQGYFNNGSVSDQLLFSGPYTCEATAGRPAAALG
ncbi:unnamed protein product, partial [Durusdinium trenchii]